MSGLDLELLLERARGTVPRAGHKARLRSRVLAAAVGGAALTTATHAAAAKSVTWLTALKGSHFANVSVWVAGGVALGSLVVAPVLWSVLEPSPPPPAPKTPSVNVSAPVLPSPVITPTRAPAPLVSETQRPLAAPSLSAMASIERETALIGEAQRALRNGSAATALSWLDRYDREIGHGSLAEEAAAARAVATCSLSKTRAVATLAAFGALYPASPLLPRVRAACSNATSHHDFELDSVKPTTKTRER